MNMRDVLKDYRIIMRLEAHPDSGNVRSLVLVGGSWGYPSPLLTTYYNMNVSALYAPPSRIPVINEATGYNFSIPSDPKAIKMAGNYCSTADAWPGPRSVTVIREVRTACHGKE